MRSNNPQEGRVPPREMVKVVLTCGDQITVRNPPLTPKVRYSCVAGLGHGYNLGWVSYTSRGVESYNTDNPGDA